MKNLLYKEFKLVMHPVILVFILAFPILAIFPNYPKFIAFIYIFTCYPIVFIGANKGVSSNDVFYSLTLPVRRKDIVLARLSFLTILQVVSSVLVCLFAYLGTFINMTIPSEELIDIGFGFNAILTLTGFSLVSMSVLDLLFLGLFYRNAKSITVPCIVGGISFSALLVALNVGVAYTPVIGPFFTSGDILVQVVTLLICLVISFGIKYLAYIISSKEFEKADF